MLPQERASDLIDQPSGLPSIADALLRCREPPLWADSVEKVSSKGAAQIRSNRIDTAIDYRWPRNSI
jgi:hypothetical protein